MFFCAKLLFYCTQLRFAQLSNKAYDDAYVKSRFDSVDTRPAPPDDADRERDDNNMAARLQRHLASVDDVSTGSSAADLTTYAGHPGTSDVELVPGPLRGAFVGDLEYDDVRLSSVVPVDVFQSSSSSSLSSDAEPTVTGQLADTPTRGLDISRTGQLADSQMPPKERKLSTQSRRWHP